MKKIAIIQARMGSTRFPGKVLQNLSGKPLIQWIVDAARAIANIDDVVVATSHSDQSIVNWCKQNKVNVVQGSETDVLERFVDAVNQHQADIVMRLTADCPLLDPFLAGQVLALVTHGHADYATNAFPATWPDGLDAEAFTAKALYQAHEMAVRASDREHVTPYIRNNQHLFCVRNVPSAIPEIHQHRWTIDTPEDLAYIEALLAQSRPNPTTWDILQTIKDHPEIKRPASERNEGFAKSIKEESIVCCDFRNSRDLLQRSLKTIPLGAQTFSKSYIQFPEKTSPMFLTHGLGSRVWDVDGNEYIDLISGLMPVVLGYNDPDINNAIQNQLGKGISFSLSTELEVELAEKMCELIPSAEKVRFAKNGTDITSAAVRLSRAYTGRDKVALCGYHGWQDWSIGTTTRNKGVPKVVSDLSTVLPYNDLAKVEEVLKTESYACLVMELTNVTAPYEGYLQGVKNLCEKYGTLLVFDEIITGFRFSLGGAQEYFGVTPHLSCFGKAMGNGMPISAIVGRNDIMKEMEEIFFSGTFGGETLSLAASLATLHKMKDQNVIEHLWSYGESLGQKVNGLIKNHGLADTIKLCGYSPWKILQFMDHPNATSFEIKTFYLQEMLTRGILMSSSFNVSFAHNDVDAYKIEKAFDETLGLLAQYLGEKSLNKHLKSPAIEPLFRVR